MPAPATFSTPTHPASQTAPTTARLVGYWIATAIAALMFAIPGFGNLTHATHIASDMAHLGYPSYFLTILGTWKILGALAIVAPRFPRLKEWAYAGMMFDLTGAAASRLASGDGTIAVIIPLLICGVVMTSWALRPRDRALMRTPQRDGDAQLT
jgi:uncharacterized membrane protein YphA (DoxX/SURF4 family)